MKEITPYQIGRSLKFGIWVPFPGVTCCEKKKICSITRWKKHDPHTLNIRLDEIRYMSSLPNPKFCFQVLGPFLGEK